MNDERLAAEVDAFFDALARDPNATFETLDPETASVIRAAVDAERSGHTELSAQARRRIWQRALASAHSGRASRPSVWRRVLSNPARLGLGGGLAMLALAVIISGRGLPGSGPKTLTPAQVAARARDAALSPAPESMRGFVTAEVVESRDEQGVVRTATTRWHAAPERWRTESRSTVVYQGVEQRGPLTVSISDGAQFLQYTSEDAIATITPIRPDESVLSARPFGPQPGTFGGAGASVYAALGQAGHCLHPEMDGSEHVAGRETYVLKLDRWTCGAVSPGALAGNWRLYVDRETFLILRASHRVDGVARLLAEVRSFSINPLVRGGTFALLPPAGVMVHARPAQQRFDYSPTGPAALR
jgi:hypothetical protein